MPEASHSEPHTSDFELDLTPSRRVGVSSVTIARNEAHNIAGLAQSLAGHVDHMILLDTGSTDNTVDLARKHGFTVHQADWHDDFAEARNIADSYAPTEWVLKIDCDERLVCSAESLTDAIRGQLTRNPRAAVNLTIESIDDSDSVASRMPAPRVYARSALHHRGALHEQLVDENGLPARTAEPEAAISLVHHGYTSEAMEQAQKVERNLRLARIALKQDSSTPLAVRHLNLSRAYSSAGERDLAIAEAQTALALIDDRTSGYAHLAAYTALPLLAQSARWGELQVFAEQVLRLAGPEANCLLLQADALVRSGQAEQALTPLASAGAAPEKLLPLDEAAFERTSQAALAASGAAEGWGFIASIAPHRPHLAVPLANSQAAIQWRRANAAGDPDSYLDALRSHPGLLVVEPLLDSPHALQLPPAVRRATPALDPQTPAENLLAVAMTATATNPALAADAAALAVQRSADPVVVGLAILLGAKALLALGEAAAAVALASRVFDLECGLTMFSAEDGELLNSLRRMGFQAANAQFSAQNQ